MVYQVSRKVVSLKLACTANFHWADGLQVLRSLQMSTKIKSLSNLYTLQGYENEFLPKDVSLNIASYLGFEHYCEVTRLQSYNNPNGVDPVLETPIENRF